MTFTTVLGTPVPFTINGHSATNGAVIPEDASVQLTSNDQSVAADVGAVPVPAGGAQSITGSFTPVGVGSTDMHLKVTTSDGSVYEDTATLLVTPLPVPGLVRVELILG